jgi:hypothetical protein
MKLDTQFSRVTVILALALLVVTLLSTGCEDSGVNAPTDGNLILTPALAHIVILEGEPSGSATFTASLFSSTGSALSGSTISFISSAGTWNRTEAVTDASGSAEAILTLQTTDPDSIDVQVRSGTLFADSTATKEGSTNDPPQAVINATPQGEQEINKVVTFDGSGSSDPDGVITCFQWTIDSDVDISDEVVQGSGSSLLQRTYADEQTLSVILRVSDSAIVGATCDLAAVIPARQFSPILAAETYNIACANTPPVADAGSSLNSTTGVVVTLDGRASFDSDGTIEEYLWTCGNGQPAQSTAVDGVVECTYSSANVYTAQLTVSDDGDGLGGCQKSSTDTTIVTVTP